MSSTPATTPQLPSGGPPAAPKSNGAKVILWIVGGFVGLFVLFMFGCMAIGFFVVHKVEQTGDLLKKNPAYAVAKFAVTNNPDVQVLSSNDSAGTLVVRDKKTGQVMNMKFDPAKKSMVVTDEHGKTVSMQLDTNKSSLVITDDQGKTATIKADGQAGNVEINGPDGTVKMGANADKAPNWVPVYPGSNPQGTFSASSASEQTGTFVFVTQDSVDKVVSYYTSALKAVGMTTSNTMTNANGKTGGMVSGQDDGRKRTILVTAGSDNDGTHVSLTFSTKP